MKKVILNLTLAVIWTIVLAHGVAFSQYAEGDRIGIGRGGYAYLGYPYRVSISYTPWQIGIDLSKGRLDLLVDLGDLSSAVDSVAPGGC